MISLPLRNQVRDRLRRELIHGVLAPGQRLTLQQLADRLSVSPTPAREALGQLEQEGLVRLEPNRGFSVAPMTAGEALEIYPLVADLEALAVELQHPFPREHMRRLQELNARMEDERADPPGLFERDLQWHEALVAGCYNSLLIRHLRSLRNRVERYERAYMKHSGTVPSSTADHRRIAHAITHAPDEVRPLLRAHWERSSDFVRRWLTDSRAVDARS